MRVIGVLGVMTRDQGVLGRRTCRIDTGRGRYSEAHEDFTGEGVVLGMEVGD